ncbi:exodeoxyribonuclease V subunit alpha [Atopomonas sediminilitoris]|uniref:exodeoxyribonuclease V subunit alpha n=1 Tax=Atopomonas sediminilitoris TaxID=2919919 RepID=UPI001F4DB672|nr:exodeoxyribonuclease V subunit alpha [Atopomonas sediminilitoris]MCJ8169397.1 exodeoxyribonuclease V subunit alpha [Atopomonas sediminilitoris]
MLPEALTAVFEQALACRGLRRLDRAVAQFLADQGEQDPKVLLAAALTSAQLGHGHTCLDLNRALRDSERLLYAEQPPSPEQAHWLPDWNVAQWCAALSASRVVATATDAFTDAHPDRPLVLCGQRLYLRRQWQYESHIAAAIEQRLHAEPLPAAVLREQVQPLFNGSAQQPDWQHIACALAARSAFAVITGGPGTGKTTTVVRLLAVLQTQALASGSGKLRIRLAAPTGKAAARLNESIAGAIAALPVSAAIRASIPAEVSTLHRLLGPLPDSRQFRHHAGNPLHLDVLVIDEASMIDLEMMAHVLAALPNSARLVLLGDKDQLASVEAGAVLGDLCAAAEAGGYSAATCAWVAEACAADIQPWQAPHTPRALDQQVAMLRHSHRFDSQSGIGQLASAVNQGRLTLSAFNSDDARLITLSGEHDAQLEQLCLAEDGYRGYLSALRHAPGNDADEAQWHDWALQRLNDFGRFQLLTPLRQGPWGVEGLNLRIANSLLHAGLLSAAQGWYAGRPVLMTHNDYSLGLMNGDVGITLNWRDEGLRVAFKVDGALKLVRPSRLPEAQTVFAMTVHKSQGSEFNHTALVLPPEPSPLLTRELLYTGITRARQRFTLLTANPSLLPSAAATRTERASGLAERFA